MSNPIGSPKTLHEAIAHALEYANQLRVESRIDDKLTVADSAVFATFVKDYLAQIFAHAMIEAAETEAEKRIERLWKRIAA